MRVLLVYVVTENINMPVLPAGMAVVAASAEMAGHEVKSLCLEGGDDFREVLGRVIGDFSPQVVGFSVRNIDDQSEADTKFLLPRVREAVDVVREVTSAPVVLGGAGFSIFPQACLEYLGADMGVEGEGEIAFNRLLSCLDEGGDPAWMPCVHLPGRPPMMKLKPGKSMDAYPMPLPGRHLEIPERTGGPPLWIPIQTRRGCALKCSYCSTPAIEGTALRTRSPHMAARGLEAWADAGHRRIFFVDNTFNLPASYVKDLCRAIEPLDLKWLGILYPARVDGELVSAMARAGCQGVSLGCESGSDKTLAALNKRFTKEDVRQANRLVKDHGIARQGFLLLGGPEETRDTVMESLEFIEELDCESVKVTTGIRIYPNTALHQKALEEGVVSPDDDLLEPRFYLRPELKDWLAETVEELRKRHPDWL